MDENSSISDLKGIEGLTVYDQDQFEERVSKNLSQYVEKQKREHDVKQLNGELKSVIENLGKAKENLSKVEKSLNDAVNRGITSDRRLKVFLEQQDKLRSEVEQLAKSKDEIEATLSGLDPELEEGEIETEKKIDEPSETEQEKSIRLGQMTAFGKVLISKSEKDEDIIANRKYVKDWMHSGVDIDEEKYKKMNKVSSKYTHKHDASF